MLTKNIFTTMRKNLLTATLVLSSLLSSSSLAQEAEIDRFTLCSKFPQNSKCENFEAIVLDERPGEKASCQLSLGDFQAIAACKINLTEDTLTFYQEQGNKIEQLDNQRLTIEYNIPLERILIANSQIWNGVHRWEIGYLEDTEAGNKNSSNNLILLTNEELSQAIAANLKNPTRDDSIAMLNRGKPSQLITEVSSDMTEVIEQLVETKECIGCDLQNADLTDVDLKQANLERANLAGANLEKANLQNSYLMGANLEGANLREAKLEEVFVTDANFSNADFSNAKIESINFEEADFCGAIFTEEELSSKVGC